MINVNGNSYTVDVEEIGASAVPTAAPASAAPVAAPAAEAPAPQPQAAPAAAPASAPDTASARRCRRESAYIPRSRTAELQMRVIPRSG